MFVLMQHTTDAVTSVDGQVGDPVRIGDRFGQWGERSGDRHALMRATQPQRARGDKRTL